MQSDTEIKKKIGQKLRKLRKEKGFTSHESFALEYHLPRVSYFKHESGAANMTLNALLELLSIHQISLEEFFAGFDAVPDIPEQTKEKRRKSK